MVGRKTKLNEELIKEAESLLRAGNYTMTVCDYLGIHKSTFYKWLAEGEHAKSGLKKELFDAIKKAEATAEIRNVNIVQKAAEDDWKAAMTYLERKFPDKWGRREKLDADLKHSGEVIDRHEQHTTIDVRHRIEKYGSVIDELIKEGNVRTPSGNDN